MKKSKILTAVALSVSQTAALQLRDKEVQQDLERVDLKQLVGPGPQIEVQQTTVADTPCEAKADKYAC